MTRTPEQQAARSRRRRIGWTIAGLLSLPLWGLLALVLLNAHDEPPTPWPAALTLRAESVAKADNLLLQLAEADPAPAVLLGPCTDRCAAQWRPRLADLAAEGRKAAAFVALCEAAAAPRLHEPLGERVDEDWGLPRFSPLQACHSWLGARALQADAAGDRAATLHWLQRSHALAQAALRDLRSLVGHLQALSLWSRHLHLLQQVQAPPAARLPLAQLDLAALRAQQRAWSVIEAQYQRRLVDVLNLNEPCVQEGNCPWLRIGRQPEAHKRLVAERWLRVLAVLESPAPTADLVPALRQTFRAPRDAWTQLRHRYASSVEADMAPLSLSYFDRAADVEAAQQLAVCALGGRSDCGTLTLRDPSARLAPPLQWPAPSAAPP